MATFDRDFARLLLEICRYTYAAGFNSSSDATDKEEALELIKKAGVPDAPTMLKDDHPVSTSVACITSLPDKNIVSYMGTKTEFKPPTAAMDSIMDWFHNFEMLAVPFKLTADQLGADIPSKDNLGGLVHRGFLEELTGVQAKVVAELLKRGGKEKPLYVTGHSQGGAEAALATRAFLAGGFNLVASYTFAAPRPGDSTFARSIPLTFPLHRIEFGDDIVPHVPPKALGGITRAVLWGLKFTSLPEYGRKLVESLTSITRDMNYEGAGSLCYGDNEKKILHVDVSAAEETTLFYTRLLRLIKNPWNWGEHHHLAGTTEDVKAGRKGNYTALVSEFQLEG